jgi:hypothetical protein
VKQVEQNYRTSNLRVAEVPAPRAGEGRLLVSTRASLISSGTEKQLIDLAKASLPGKAMARPDLVRRVVRNIGRDGYGPPWRRCSPSSIRRSRSAIRSLERSSRSAGLRRLDEVLNALAQDDLTQNHSRISTFIKRVAP